MDRKYVRFTKIYRIGNTTRFFSTQMNLRIIAGFLKYGLVNLKRWLEFLIVVANYNNIFSYFW